MAKVGAQRAAELTGARPKSQLKAWLEEQL